MTTAGFRFIPVAPQVVEPPTRFADLDLSRPAADVSVSGSLDITWAAETPICIGDGAAPVTPIRLGGAYALPGASLRGMVRAVTEIATFSHLGHINAARARWMTTTPPRRRPRLRASSDRRIARGRGAR